MKKYILIIFVAFLFLGGNSYAAEFSQSVVLNPGWNIVSTPRVLESHSFSVAETSDNFDVYVLDASSVSGWSTMADLGQTEFAPLFGYFINNKTDIDQTLAFNYEDNLSPNDKLFSRTLTDIGWYSLGIANPTYSVQQCSGTTNSNNASSILNSLSGDHSFVVDFTDANYATDVNSVAVADSWKSVVPSDLSSLNDFRDLKAYAVLITQENALYSGFQNTDDPDGCPPPPPVVVDFSSAKYTGYADQSFATPKNNTKVGHFILTNNSSESVNVETINIDSDDSGGTFTADNLTNVYIKIWNDVGTLIYTSDTKSTISPVASNSYIVNFSIPIDTTYQVEVWANIGQGITSGHYMNLEMDSSGLTTPSGIPAITTAVDGQTVTSATGSLTLANGAVPAARLINGGQTVTGYVFTLTPTHDDFTLEEVYVDLSSTLASSTGAVANLLLKDGSTTLATATVNSSTSSASFTGLNLSLPQANGTKTLTVDVVLASVGVGGNDTAGTVRIQLDGYKYRNSGGSISTINGLINYSGNNNIVVKGYPTFTNTALPDTNLTTGTKTLFKTVLSATGGQISWNDIVFTVSSNSTGGTIGTFKLWENGVDTGATAIDSSGSTTQNVEFVFATERTISAGSSVTLELRATVGGTIAATDAISTSISNPKGSSVTSDDATTQAIGSSFVWSDQSAAGHSTSTDDWFTDALVKNLAETQSLN